VHDISEGVATRIGPEPCVGTREGAGEASAGERMGQPLSRERLQIPGADAGVPAEGNTDGGVIASAHLAWRGHRHWHVRKLPGREPGGLMSGQDGIPFLVRIGKARSRSR
jgi:hypothetical protein